MFDFIIATIALASLSLSSTFIVLGIATRGFTNKDA